MNKALYNVKSYFISIPLLLIAFFYNSFPIVFYDDGDYLSSARDLIPTVWHPVFYGIFIKLSTLDFSLSLLAVPITQAVITAFLLTETLAAIGITKFSHILFILTAITLGTSATIWVGMLQPDIFTSILCLSAFLLCFQWPNLSLSKRIVISAIFILAIIVHLSHIAVTAGLLVCLWMSRFFAFTRSLFKSNTGLRVTTLLLIVSIFSILCGNRLLSGHFFISKTGHAFLINRIAKDQILYKLLSEHCHEYRYRLCDYQDFFLNYAGDEYLWPEDNRTISPLVALGDWKGTKIESYQILIDSIKHYPVEHVVAAIKQTAKQFFPLAFNDIGNPIIVIESGAIQKGLGLELKEFRHSHQQLGILSQSIRSVSPLWLLLQSISVLYIVIFILRSFLLKRDHEELLVFSLFLLLSLVVNAAVCGILSGAFPRYQNRLIWLAALVPLSSLVQKRHGIVKKY